MRDENFIIMRKFDTMPSAMTPRSGCARFEDDLTCFEGARAHPQIAVGRSGAQLISIACHNHNRKRDGPSERKKCQE